MQTDVLAEERRYFSEIRADLLKTSEGKFALVKGRALLGTFDTRQAAYEYGLGKLGNAPMLIAPVTTEEPIARFPALHLGLVHAHLQD